MSNLLNQAAFPSTHSLSTVDGTPKYNIPIDLHKRSEVRIGNVSDISYNRLPNSRKAVSIYQSEAAQPACCAALASRAPGCENGFVPEVRV